MSGTAVVLVSHSRLLADGVRELATQMARDANAVWAVGGTDDGAIGTSAPAIEAALREALAVCDEVVVLVDLGSAQLSAETAIDFLEEPLRERVAIADAPLVEGAVMAVVSAATGAAASAVRERAEEAWQMRKG